MDKPVGPTSHDVVAMVRRAVGVRRVGHTGTLDPFASGLLVMLVGRATRLAQFLVCEHKRYHGVIVLGTTTDTCDLTGSVTGTDHGWSHLADAAIEGAMSEFEGPQRQRPPTYSAKKVRGQRAYRLARRGVQPDMPEQDVEISSFALRGRTGPDLHFDASVSSGTYVRALARDLGDRLGCGAHLAELRRIAVGAFDVADAVSPDAVSPEAIHPARDALAHMQSVTVGNAERDCLRQGQTIEASDSLSGTVAVLAGNELVAVADADGTRLQPRVVLT